MIEGTLSIQVLTSFGKVAATRLSVPMLRASFCRGDSVLPRQQETGNSHCPTSAHGDNANIQAMVSNTAHRKTY